MTSQIASIALEKTAVQQEAVQVEDGDLVEWVSNISRSLQTELQSVYHTLHGEATETIQSPITSPMTASLLSSSPLQSPLSLSPSFTSPSPASISVQQSQSEHVPATHAAASSDVPVEVKGRRRRKTKTKDSFNHMQRKCASCQRTETTKWRHGPLGSNTLCNTCGLAYSRKKKREAEQLAKQSAPDS